MSTNSRDLVDDMHGPGPSMLLILLVVWSFSALLTLGLCRAAAREAPTALTRTMPDAVPEMVWREVRASPLLPESTLT